MTRTMTRLGGRWKLTLIAGLAATLAACGTLPPANAPGLSEAIGDALPGAQGLTLADQERIDSTVARGCASGVFTRAACKRHTPASAARRRELGAGQAVTS